MENPAISKEKLEEMIAELKKKHFKKTIIKLEIPYKFPSLNEYVNACRTNQYKGAEMKKSIEKDIVFFINKLPEFENPVKIHFLWVEGNKKRDLDNICFAKKFILDSMVKCGKLKDDNRKIVTGFTDSFDYANETKVILEIEEITNESRRNRKSDEKVEFRK